MDFLEKLDFMMEKYGLNKRTLSIKSDIPYTTIDNWYKRGYEGLKLSTIRKLSEYFNTLLDFWVLEDVTDPNYGKANSFNVKYEEAEHIKKYRTLDTYGQEAVDGILDVEWRRCIEEEAARLREAKKQVDMEAAGEIVPTIDMIVYDNPAAAGTPLYAESEFERISFPLNEIPAGTDFGIRISGRSMEPTVKDGSIVWIHKTLELRNGTIGVFMLNDSAVCKRYFKNEDGTISLESDNPEFEPVSISEFDSLMPVGEVLSMT